MHLTGKRVLPKFTSISPVIVSVCCMLYEHFRMSYTALKTIEFDFQNCFEVQKIAQQKKNDP